jgi:hypothetical protein
MTRLSVTETRPGVYEVEVTGDKTTTTHVVEVPAGLAMKLGGGSVTDESLLEESFRYLLEREPQTSILCRFSIEQIGDYFPQWPEEISPRLRGQ